MEGPEVRHDESVASLPVDKAPVRPSVSGSLAGVYAHQLPSRRPRPIPRFPGSGSGSRQRAGETASVMPPPASASVSSSSRQPSASSETSRVSPTCSFYFQFFLPAADFVVSLWSRIPQLPRARPKSSPSPSRRTSAARARRIKTRRDRKTPRWYVFTRQ